MPLPRVVDLLPDHALAREDQPISPGPTVALNLVGRREAQRPHYSMTFLHQGWAAFVLITLTLVLQSAGMASLIQWIKAQFPKGISHLGLFRSAVLVVRFTSLLVCLHMLEILLWAWFYRWKCLPTWEGAFYFSAANYSTVGSADIVLQQAWRTMGPIESFAGMLMCGLSAGFVFAIVTRLVEHEDPELAESRPLAQTAGPAADSRDNEKPK